PRAEDGLGGRLVLGLGLELLIRALLERLDGLERAALLDPNLALLGGHRGPFYEFDPGPPPVAEPGPRPHGDLAPLRTADLPRSPPLAGFPAPALVASPPSPRVSSPRLRPLVVRGDRGAVSSGAILAECQAPAAHF